jgi:hypothetical protein
MKYVVKLKDVIFVCEAASTSEIAHNFSLAYELALPKKGQECMCHCGTHFRVYGYEWKFEDFEAKQYNYTSMDENGKLEGITQETVYCLAGPPEEGQGQRYCMLLEEWVEKFSREV